MRAGPNGCAGLRLQLEYTTKEKVANTMKFNELKEGQYFYFDEIQNKGEPFKIIRRVLSIAKRPGLFEVERVTNKHANDWDGFSRDIFFLSKHAERKVILLK